MTVTAGQAQGVVVVTGADTEIGRISSMLIQVEVLTVTLAMLLLMEAGKAVQARLAASRVSDRSAAVP